MIRFRKQLDSSTGIELGYQTNILEGAKYNWVKPLGDDIPFFSPDRPGLVQPGNHPPQNPNGTFEVFTRVYLYYSWLDLLGGLYPWNLVETDENIDLPTGPFIIGEPNQAEIEKQLCEQLGIKEEDTDPKAEVGFALVTIRKINLTISYPTAGPEIERELREALNNLPIEEQDSNQVDNISPYIDFFHRYGTHYLNTIELGDIAYQIFVYERDILEKIVQDQGYTPGELDGPGSIFFRNFTARKTQYSGHTKYEGDVLVVSRDPKFEGASDYLRDNMHHLDSSVFMFVWDSENTRHLLDSLDRQVPIRCDLKSLSYLIGDSKQRNQWNWVLKNALYKKYHQTIYPNFPAKINSPYDYEQIYRSFSAPLPSRTPTRTITFSRMRFDLQEISIFNSEVVRKLFIFADVIEIKADSQLPGEEIYIVCRVLLAHTSPDRAPIISTENQATLHLDAREYYGTAVFQDYSGEQQLIVNGQELIDITRPNGRTSVGCDRNYLGIPPHTHFTDLKSRSESLLQTPLSGAYSLLNYHADEDTREVTHALAQWYADFLQPVEAEHRSLIDIRSQALCLLKITHLGPGLNLVVPYLNYTVYEASIAALVEAAKIYDSEREKINTEIARRKSEEQLYENINQINENIKKIGKFLLEQNRAIAEKEGDIIANYDRIIESLEQRIGDAEALAAGRLEELEAQQVEIDRAGEAVEEEIRRQTWKSIFQCILDVVGAMMGMFNSGRRLLDLSRWFKLDNLGEKISYIDEVLEKVQAALDLIENFRDLIDAITPPQDANDRIEGIPDVPGDGVEFPDELEWEIFDLRVEEVMGAFVDEGISSARSFEAEAKIFSAIGRSYLYASQEVTSLERQKLDTEHEREIAQRYQERLQELEQLLDLEDLAPLDDDRIDLYEIGEALQLSYSRVVSRLMRTLILQDAALQYFYLQPPTQLTDHSLAGMVSFIAWQRVSAEQTLEQYPKEPRDRLEYVLVKDIRTADLQQNSPLGPQLKLTPEQERFANQLRVRLKKVDAEILRLRFAIQPADKVKEDGVLSREKLRVEFQNQGITLSERTTIEPEEGNRWRVKDDLNYYVLEQEGDRIDTYSRGVRSTNSGKVHLLLSTDACPFQDRGLQEGQILPTLTYATSYQEFDCVYDLDSGESTEGEVPPGFELTFMRMTPFTNWTLRLFRGGENAGIQFYQDSVAVRLVFQYNAIRRRSGLNQKQQISEDNDGTK